MAPSTLAWAPLLLGLAVQVELAASLPKEECYSGSCDADEFEDSYALLQHRSQSHILQDQEVAQKGSNSVPVFVMLSLTTVSQNGTLLDPAGLRANLTKLKDVGAHGIMLDVWWGITEPQPKKYDFAAYKELVEMAKQIGLKVQFVTSFHQCCNEGDSCYIPLPSWVRDQSGIWFKNALGDETRAYISLFADNVKIPGSGTPLRTPSEMYADWLHAFRAEFRRCLGKSIVEMMIGMGTDGELKYPSYENGPWSFPGIGMLQAFDSYALKSLAAAAKKAGKPSWGTPPGVNETGDSNSFPNETEFWREGGGYRTDQGKFFLAWYSTALGEHGSTILRIARQALGRNVKISGKIAGVHWWYKYPSHAAEVAAGYYNTNGVNGYRALADMFARSGWAIVDFTCLEMTDASQPAYADCGPQELVEQVQSAAHDAGVPFTGENALSFYNAGGYNQMLTYKPPTGSVSSVTYLRISDELLEPANLALFGEFCGKMADSGFVTPFNLVDA